MPYATVQKKDDLLRTQKNIEDHRIVLMPLLSNVV